MSENEMSVVQFYTEHGIRKRFTHDPFYFDCFLFSHSSSLIVLDIIESRAANVN